MYKAVTVSKRAELRDHRHNPVYNTSVRLQRFPRCLSPDLAGELFTTSGT